MHPPNSHHPSPSDTVIAVDRLAKRYGEVQAVADVSFTVRRGTVVGMLGPNGAGKTTTLRMLLGLVDPTAGTALIGGVAYGDLERPTSTVGALIDVNIGHPGRTARGHLAVLASAMGAPRSRIAEVLDQVGLDHAAKRRIGGFSHGMRQRLGLAAALLGRPEILVLDEPSNGLDPEGIRWLRETVRGFAADGGTVLLSSHVLAEVAQTADDLVVIDHGRVAAHSTVEEFTSRLGGRASIRVRTPSLDTLVAALGRGGHDHDVVSPELVLVHDVPAQELGWIAAEAGAVIYEMSAEDSDLETAFFNLTGSTESKGTPS